MGLCRDLRRAERRYRCVVLGAADAACAVSVRVGCGAFHSLGGTFRLVWQRMFPLFALS